MRTQSDLQREAFEPITEVIPVVPAAPLTPSVRRCPPAAAATRPAPLRPSLAAPAWLRAAVTGLGVLLVAALAGLGVEHARPGAFAALRAPAAPLPPLVITGPGARPSPAPGAPDARQPSTPALAASLRSSGSGAPQLVALRPASGRAGASVTISGTRLQSASGVILATFNGVAASTRCPTTSECLATVPAGVGAGALVVRVRTDTGRSNGLVFHAS